MFAFNRFRGRRLLLIAGMLLCGIASSFHTPERAGSQSTVGVVITSVDEDGALVPGACFTAIRADDANSTFRFGGIDTSCDAGDGADDGSTAVTIFGRSGRFAIYQLTAAAGFMVGNKSSFEYEVGVTSQIEVVQRAGGETLNITAIESNGEGLTEGCFYLARDNGIGLLGQPVGWNCLSESSTGGKLQITGLPAGEYLLRPPFTQALLPDDFELAVSVRSGEENSAEVTFTRMSTTSSIAVSVVDDAGTPILTDICLNARQTDGEQLGFFSNCDSFDNSTPGVFEPDGIVLLSGVEPGAYLIEPATVPAGYQISEQSILHVSITDRGAEEATLTLEPGGQSLSIVSPVDASTRFIFGSCFTIYEAAAGFSRDNWNVLSCMRFDFEERMMSLSISVPVGELVIVHRPGGPDEAPTPDQHITVGENEQVSVTVETLKEAVIKVTMLDDAGKSVRNGCVSAFSAIEGYRDGATSLFGEPAPAACDIDDGYADGKIAIHRLPPGKYTIVPVTMPSGYALPASKSTTVKAGVTRNMEMQTSKGGAQVIITIMGPDENPDQQSRCVAVFADDGGEPGARITQRCDWYDRDNDGRITIGGLPGGSYLVGLDANDSLVPQPEIPLSKVVAVDGETVAITIDIPYVEHY